jgi:hypothetical protein
MDADQGLLRATLKWNESGSAGQISFKPTHIVYRRVLCDNGRDS